MSDNEITRLKLAFALASLGLCMETIFSAYNHSRGDTTHDLESLYNQCSALRDNIRSAIETIEAG